MTENRLRAARRKLTAMLQMQDLLAKSYREFKEGSIVKGRILEIRPREVLVDIGYKSEGVIPSAEFEDIESMEVGDEVEVLLERLENDEGMVVLSKEKAAYRQNWNKIAAVFAGDGLIKGKVKSVVKGGLMVNIGVEAFLPASQIDIIPPKDLQQFVGNTYDFKIVKINDDRKNVVLSRRELIEQERSEKRQKFLEGVKVGDMVQGSVKNLTDFGAFIDLDGMDGLLHITDMTWGRLGHPSELLKVGQPLEVIVLDINKEKERVSLGLKQTQKNPWDQIEERFPAGQHVKGKITNLVPYGAFVELEEGVEGLIHVSELSWTKRIMRPSDVLTAGPGSRSGRPRGEQGRAENLVGPAPARTESVGRDREEIYHRQPRQGRDPQHDRLRRVRGAGRRHRWNDPRLRLELDPQDQSPERSL